MRRMKAHKIYILAKRDDECWPIVTKYPSFPYGSFLLCSSYKFFLFLYFLRQNFLKFFFNSSTHGEANSVSPDTVSHLKRTCIFFSFLARVVRCFGTFSVHHQRISPSFLSSILYSEHQPA